MLASRTACALALTLAATANAAFLTPAAVRPSRSHAVQHATPTPTLPLQPVRSSVMSGRAREPVMEAFSFDPFDRDVFRILMDAQSEARVLGSPSVGTQHLLLAATMQNDDVQASLERAGCTTETVRNQLRGDAKGAASMPGLDRLFAATAKDELLPFAKDTERALKESVTRSKTDGGSLSRDELITWRELMLSVLMDEAADTGSTVLLKGLSLDRKAVYESVKSGERELVKRSGTL